MLTLLKIRVVVLGLLIYCLEEMGLFCESRRRWPKSKEKGRSERYADALL